MKMKGFERGACALQTGSAKNTETRETEPGAAQAAAFVTTAPLIPIPLADFQTAFLQLAVQVFALRRSPAKP